ncbi:MAG: VIT1/CCC1 transporter family protein [Candidatus Hodarchaeales archaeon]|jgi:predicted membrane protein (TIGR00267 family)
MNVAKTVSRIRTLLSMGDSGDIAKRYFVMNAFDGALTALGIILGSWLAGISDPKILILAGMGASIAMGVSGGFGAYLTENALKKEELADFEDAMLERFENTLFDEAAKWESWFVAVVDGISPFMAGAIAFSPFFLATWLGWQIGFAYLSAIILTFFILFLLGAYLGRISKENIPKSGLKMLIAGIITGLLVMLLEFL